jgi:hypothetical protein
METLAKNFDNYTVLSEIEMNKVLGGTYSGGSANVEDEDAWL